jgi:hypothetical protein
MTLTRHSNSRCHSSKLWIAALTAALSLIGGAQALAPASALAMDDPDGKVCVAPEGVDIPVGELVCVVDEVSSSSTPAPPPVGPGYGTSTGSDGDGKTDPRRATNVVDARIKKLGGARKPPKPTRKPIDWPGWRDKLEWALLQERAIPRCELLLDRITSYWQDQGKINNGELGALRYVPGHLVGRVSTRQLHNFTEEWSDSHCPDLTPPGVY